jgi:hypothetical protein
VRGGGAGVMSFFNSQPELIHEIVELVRQYPASSQCSPVFLKVCLLSVNCLAALAASHIGSRNVNVFQVRARFRIFRASPPPPL